MKSENPYFVAGAYYLAYVANDGDWYVVYYYTGMAAADLVEAGGTASVWRCPGQGE